MLRYFAFVSALCALSDPLLAAAITGKVDVRTAPGTGPAPTVVYAEPLDKPAPARPLTVRLSQKDKMFAPAILAVPVGSTVEFPNDDPIFHNVFSLSAPAPFDLGLYRAGASKSRQFTQSGGYRVFCNIHPQMMAHITVVPTPFVTIAGPDGRFTLDLPAGAYRITARSDRAAAVTVTMTVGAGADTVPELKLDESRYVAIPHKNKFGQDYPASAYEKKGGGSRD
jgi:plastocyanin